MEKKRKDTSLRKEPTEDDWLRDSCTIIPRDKSIITFYTDVISFPFPIIVSVAIYTSGIGPRTQTYNEFFSLFPRSDFPCFSSKRNFTPKSGLNISFAITLLALCSFRQQCFIFKRDILTLTGGRRGGTVVTLLLSPAIFSCRGSQMVRFSAHMVVFLRDHHSRPAWQK